MRLVLEHLEERDTFSVSLCNLDTPLFGLENLNYTQENISRSIPEDLTRDYGVVFLGERLPTTYEPWHQLRENLERIDTDVWQEIEIRRITIGVVYGESVTSVPGYEWLRGIKTVDGREYSNLPGFADLTNNTIVIRLEWLYLYHGSIHLIAHELGHIILDSVDEIQVENFAWRSIQCYLHSLRRLH